jgi:type I site-specific restriction-modification system R (restriction) subunit
MSVTEHSLEKRIKELKKHFLKSQMFGFTGTPIFADNAVKISLGNELQKNYLEIAYINT